MGLSPSEIRNLFPQIKYLDQAQESYLDSSSTTLKFQFVIDSLRDLYSKQVSNVHRGDHQLSLNMTEKYEKARQAVGDFLNASCPEEIVFTRGTTEGINFLAHSLGESLKEGDEILLTEMEHHSNLIPWQMIAHQKKLKLKFIPVQSDATLDLKKFKPLLNSRTKIFSISHVSNVTGVINPIEEMIAEAQKHKVLTIVDAAQSASLLPLDVQKLGCDFLVFSGHKIFSPAGIGVLFGKKSHLSSLSPYQTGGGTIADVSLYDTQWAEYPYKFEAGTPPIELAIVLGEALSFLKKNIDYEWIFNHEQKLVDQTFDALSEFPQVKVVGSSQNRSNVVSFVLEELNTSDVSFVLTKKKVAVRSGHHCCIPLMKALNLSSGTLRASFSIYNREQDVQNLKKGVKKSIEILTGS